MKKFYQNVIANLSLKFKVCNLEKIGSLFYDRFIAVQKGNLAL